MKEKNTLLNFLSDNKKNLLYIFLLDLILIIPGVMSPIFKGFFTDSIIVGGDMSLFPTLLLLMLIVSVIGTFAFWLRRSQVSLLSVKIGLSGTAEYVRSKLYSPFRELKKSDGIAMMSNSVYKDLAADCLTGDFMELLVAAVSAVFYFVMMFKTDMSFTWLVILLLAVHFGVSKISEKIIEKFTPEGGTPSYKIQLEGDKMQANGLRNMLTFKASASESNFFMEIIENKISFIRAKQNSDNDEACQPFGDIPYVFFSNILLLICATRIMNREFSIGSYLAFEAFALAFFASVSTLKDTGYILEEIGSFIKLHKTFAGTVVGFDIATDNTLENTEKLSGNIELKDVYYVENDISVLDNISLSIKKGERIAVVGNDIRAKNALVDLLQGLVAPDGGKITMDGTLIENIPKSVFFESVGCAQNNPHFFPATIAENITLWDTDVTNNHIKNMLSMLGLGNYIEELKGGYDYIVTENGSNLSGGQRQVVELIRAFMYSPSIVILNNATTALGIDANNCIASNLKNGYTVINVTNLMYTTTDYDRIIIMENGKIADQGSPAELMMYDNYYSREMGFEQ